MQAKFADAFRAILTITGIILLIVFGARAASQADDMELAGGSHRQTLPFHLATTGTAALLQLGKTTFAASVDKLDTATTSSASPATDSKSTVKNTQLPNVQTPMIRGEVERQITNQVNTTSTNTDSGKTTPKTQTSETTKSIQVQDGFSQGQSRSNKD